MIAIPNTEMPKSCEECPLTARDEWDDLYCIILTDDILAPKDIMTDCPLIDIVTCGECKYYKREYCRLDPFWERDTEPNDFCSRGERRADD